MSISPALVVNFVLFQLGWLVSVVGAARGYPLAGVAYAAAFLVLHHWHIGSGRARELVFVLACAGFGFVIDSALVMAGIIAFPAHAGTGFPTTLWMVGLWLMFAMTLRHSLGWLRSRYVLGAALGAVFGPLAYWVGSRIGAINLGGESAAVVAIALAWTGSMVCLLYLERLTRLRVSRASAGGIS